MSIQPGDVAVTFPVLLLPDGVHNEAPVVIPMQLVWVPKEALKVKARVGLVPWSLSRDLLLAGMDYPAGIGDVMLLPASEDHCELVLSSPSGRATLQVPTHLLRAFVAQTIALVPVGEESFSWDDEAGVQAW